MKLYCCKVYVIISLKAGVTFEDGKDFSSLAYDRTLNAIHLSLKYNI